MKIYFFMFPLLLVLLLTNCPAEASTKKDESTNIKLDYNTNTTLMTVAADVDLTSANKVAYSHLSNHNSSKIAEKTSYPKKVHRLKKRPTKMPTSFVTVPSTRLTKAKRKKVTDVTAAFKDLPADDLEFIKELDKQFQLHGDKIKIKVERENSTEPKQTSKRTIDGELGYGAYPSHNGYKYERPKFMFYPYSQDNIPADAPGYHLPKTEVTIQPSYSYELEPEIYLQKNEEPEVVDVPHRYPQPPEQSYEEPVIVLRIPGPTKYASHLQALLQQYLEIRAAQYLRILEETELQNQQQHGKQEEQQQHQDQQQYQQHVQQQQYHQQHQQQHKQHQQYYQQHQQYYQQQQHNDNQQQHHLHPHQLREQHLYIYEQQQQPAQTHDGPTTNLQPPPNEQHTTQQLPHEGSNDNAAEITYVQHVAATPQSDMYPEIDEVYQTYKGRHSLPSSAAQQQPPAVHVTNEEQPQHEQQYYPGIRQQPVVAHYYYTPHPQSGLHGGDNYQNVYFMAFAQHGAYDERAAQATTLPQQPIYVQEEEQAQQGEEHDLAALHAALALTENNPRQTHTKVIYTHKNGDGADNYADGHTSRPFQQHPGTTATAYQHQTRPQLQQQQLPYTSQQQQHLHLHHHQQQQQQQQHNDYDVSTHPFNFHAYHHKSSAAGARRDNRKRGAPKPTTTTIAATIEPTDKQFQQIRDFVRDNLGAKMSTTVELKTKRAVKG